MADVTTELSVEASVETADPMTEVFIRETCNGAYKVIIRKKGSLWFKSEESFATPMDALEAIEDMLKDFIAYYSEITLSSTTGILPEPNASRVYKVVTV